VNGDRSDVIVAGGGAIGCAIAWRLAQRGSSVTVVERGVPGTGATAAAAGMLSPLGELRHAPALAALGFASLSLWPAFAEELHERTGIDVELRRSATLHVSLGKADDAALDEVLEAARGAGVEDMAGDAARGVGAEDMTGDAARACEPALAPSVRRAVLVTGDMRVDSRRLGHALWHAAQQDGVVFRPGVSVRRVVHDYAKARIRGVRLDDGTELLAETTVIAAGAWSGGIEGLPGRRPVFPVRGEMFAVGPAGAATMDATGGLHAQPLVTRMIHGPRGYLIPRDNGNVLVGATVDDAGFAPGPTPAGIAAMIAMAVEVAPGIAALPLLETWSGFRPATPDHMPLLGGDPALDGLIWATGHYRNGILLTPITAVRIATLVAGEPAGDLAAFAPNRFD